MASLGIEYLLVAYLIAWIGWFAYLLFLNQKQSSIDLKLQNLEKMVESRGRKRKD